MLFKSSRVTGETEQVQEVVRAWPPGFRGLGGIFPADSMTTNIPEPLSKTAFQLSSCLFWKCCNK